MVFVMAVENYDGTFLKEILYSLNLLILLFVGFACTFVCTQYAC